MMKKIKKSQLQKFEFWIIAFILFFFGLSVPKISQALVYVVFLILFLHWQGRIVKDFAFPVLLLLSFIMTYYLALFLYGFAGLSHVIHRPLLFIGFYALGYSLDRSRVVKWPYGLGLLMLVLVSGTVFYTFLCLYFVPSNQVIEIMATRTVDSFWLEGETTNGTIVGLFASLGLCFAPVAIFSKDKNLSMSYFLPLTALIFLLFAVCLYAITVLQVRSPIIALGMALLLTAVIFVFSNFIKGGPQRRFMKLLLAFLLLVMAVYLLLPSERQFDFSAIFARFDRRGLNTPRYGAWEDLLVGLPKNLMGGRHIPLNGLNYAHNLWLDIAYDVGIFPLFFLVIFHIFHLRSFFNIITSRLPLFVRTVVASMGVSFFVGFMVEPVLSGSVIYFAISCFFLGMVRRLAREIKRAPAEVYTFAGDSFSLGKAGMQNAV